MGRIAEIRRATTSCPRNEVDEIPAGSAAKIKDGIKGRSALYRSMNAA